MIAEQRYGLPEVLSSISAEKNQHGAFVPVADEDMAMLTLGPMGDVGRRIQQAREASGMSQRQLADAVKDKAPELRRTTGAHISKIETKHDKVAPKLLAAIAETTGYDMFWLATGRERDAAGPRKSDPNALLDALAGCLLDDAGLAELDSLRNEKPIEELLLEVWRLHRAHDRLASTHVQRTSKKSTG